jgi:hypothetical protein
VIAATAGPGPGKVTLRWNRSGQPQFRKYYVHWDTVTAPEARMDSLVLASDTVYTASGLENGKAYHFRISAVDQGGNPSPYSAGMEAVPDGTPPAVPAPLTALPDDRSVTLAWAPSADADFLAYLVYQRNASGPIARIDSITDVHAVTRKVAGLKNGTPYSFLVAAVDQVGNHSGFTAEAVAIPAYLLTPAAPAIAFGRIPIGSAAEAGLRIANASGLPVPVDSVRLVNAAFSLSGSLATFPARTDTSLTLRFAPGKPAGGDFRGAMQIYFGGSPSPLEIDLEGSATARPYCRIDKIAPGDISWDTSSVLSFLATANDSDNAGEGDRITAYLWSTDGVPIGENASGFTLHPSQLGIGAHAIVLRVVDNEGDTSLAATGTVVVRGKKPLVRIDSVFPGGLILRGSDTPRFRCTAYDADEGADPAHDGLRSFGLYSTLQGRLSSAKDTALDPSALVLGVHGFYAMAVDGEGDTAWSDTLRVPVQTGVGLALIVAGTDFNDNQYFYENIAPNCNWVYSKLRQRGFTDSLITYFNPVGWQSIGGNYHQDSRIVDETEMSSARLRERIQAFKPRVRNGVPLVLSFIGHGGRADKQNGRFYLSPTESITPDSLDAWLDTFNQDAEGRVTDSLATPIVIVLDFCYAGSFFPKLRSTSQNRMVIAASASNRQAYFQYGQSFSYAFFKQVGKGGSLAQAWAAANSWSDANTLIGQERANPLANADNDNTPNESEDMAILSGTFIGGSQKDQSPEATWKDVQLDFDASRSTLGVRAVPEGPATVDTAWYTLLAPDFAAPAPGSANPFASYPLVLQPDGSFAGRADLQPVLAGEYLFIVQGIAEGREMMPVAKRTLPTTVGLTRRAGLPLRFDLGGSFPNPSASLTSIPFALTRPGPVRLVVWDMQGRPVRTLAEGMMRPGFYSMRWDGRGQSGQPVGPGVYVYSLASGEGFLRRTLVRGR